MNIHFQGWNYHKIQKESRIVLDKGIKTLWIHKLLWGFSFLLGSRQTHKLVGKEFQSAKLISFKLYLYPKSKKEKKNLNQDVQSNDEGFFLLLGRSRLSASFHHKLFSWLLPRFYFMFTHPKFKEAVKYLDLSQYRLSPRNTYKELVHLF